MGTRISILRPMAGLSYFQCLMGTGTCIFRRWKNTGRLQKTPPPLTFLLSPSGHMFPYRQYNVDKELLDCLEIIYNLIDFLGDIRLALETEKKTWLPLSADLLTPSKPLESTKLRHVFIPLWWLYCLCLPDNSLSWRTLIWLQTWKQFPFITLFL